MNSNSLKDVHAFYERKDYVAARDVLRSLKARFPDFRLYARKLEECERTIEKLGLDSTDADRTVEQSEIAEHQNAAAIMTSREARDRGNEYLAESNLEAAQHYFQSAITQESQDIVSLIALAQIHLSLARYSAALDLAKKAVSVDQNARKAYQIAEQACIELQRFAEANEFFLGQPEVVYEDDPRNRGKNPTLHNSFTMPAIVGSGNDYTHILERTSMFVSQERAYTKKASIIMPVFNRSEILANTLAALTHQTYPAELIEVIVVDDGSSDQVHEVIRKYETRLNLIYARQPDDGYRLAAARNLGIRLSSGDAALFMDADILPCPTDVEEYMKVMHVSDEAVLIGHRRYVDVSNLNDDAVLMDIKTATNLPSINPDNDVADHRDDSGASIDWRIPTYKNNDTLRKDLWPFTKGAGGNLAVPMTLIRRAGYVDEDFAAWGCEDMEFNFRLFNEGAYFIPMLNIMSLHQEPLGAPNVPSTSSEDEESFRAKGHKITRELLIKKCSVPTVRQYLPGLEMEVPKVSIYIPAYNAERYIKQAIDSCLNQDFGDLEVCVCNDGSTDRTLEILETYFDDNPRVRWKSQPNAGIAAATNCAIGMCRGMYIGQLDADDVLKPNAVRSCVVVLDNKHVDAVYADCDYIDSDGREIRNGWCGGEYQRDWMATAMIATHFRMFRKRLWSRVEPCDERFKNAVDFDLWLKLSERGEIEHIHKKLYSYRWHGGNTSIQDRKHQESNHFKVVESGLKRTGMAKYWEAAPTGNRLNPREFRIREKRGIVAPNPNEIIFLIPTCEKYSHKKNAVRRTWAAKLGERGFSFYFLQGNPALECARVEDDTLYVPCEDDYESLLLKLVLGYDFLQRNEEFSFVYKIDDDCFPNLERIETMILPQLFGSPYFGGATHKKGAVMDNKWHYGKCSTDAFDKPYKYEVAPFDYAKGGYGYFVRRDALSFITREIPTLKKELEMGIYSYEDVRIAEFLYAASISVQELNDYQVAKSGKLADLTLIYDIEDPSKFDEYSAKLPNAGEIIQPGSM